MPSVLVACMTSWRGAPSGPRLRGFWPGVEQVVEAGVVNHDAARVGVEVQVVLGAVLQGDAVVLELREVLGGDKVP